MQLLTQLAKTYANCMCSARSIRILFFYIFSRRVPNFRLNAPNARENCCHLLGQRVIAIVRVSERGSAREKERERNKVGKRKLLILLFSLFFLFFLLSISAVTVFKEEKQFSPFILLFGPKQRKMVFCYETDIRVRL